MMSDVVIRVENLSKKYIIRHQSDFRTNNFREVITNSTKDIIRSINPFSNKIVNNKPKQEIFWALKDINFEINEGDKVGIIGRNGAGKSTLLKLISRITEPTTGKIHIIGRIASLLEVGTGFHPELTGRENIYLNGAILGMSRAEIRAKFDEIVSFAEVEKFLDTPVKRYSSGMHVRLAFAIAAHLEPEILVVDEVLAVGDVDFQKKCLGKMGEVSKEGRTILFVSHKMSAIEQLCNKAIILKNGKIVEYTNDVRHSIGKYLLTDFRSTNQSEWCNVKKDFYDDSFHLSYFAIKRCSDNQAVSSPIRNDEEFEVHIEGYVKIPNIALQLGYELFDSNGTLIYRSLYNDGATESWPKLKKGKNIFTSAIPKRFLNEGTYRVEIFQAIFCRYNIITPLKNSPLIYFKIEGGLSDSPYWISKRPGIIAPELKWIVKE